MQDDAHRLTECILVHVFWQSSQKPHWNACIQGFHQENGPATFRCQPMGQEQLAAERGVQRFPKLHEALRVRLSTRIEADVGSPVEGRPTRQDAAQVIHRL